MKITPINSRVIVRPDKKEEITAGGIIIPDTVQERPSFGTVVAAAAYTILDDGGTRPLEVKTGQSIMYGKYAGTEITIDGEELLIMRDVDVIAIVEK